MKAFLSLVLLVIFTIPNKSCKSGSRPNDSAKVVFTKGNCYRKCPVYSLELDLNGRAIFYGQDTVMKLGKHDFEIDTETLHRIKEILSKIDFSNLRKSYNTNIRDMAKTTIAYGDQTITYKGFKDVPKELRALSSLFENLLADKNYINY